MLDITYGNKVANIQSRAIIIAYISATLRV